MSIAYRNAGLLDVPMIFELMQEGAERGSFSDLFVGNLGSFRLLSYLVRGVGLQRLQSSPSLSHCSWLCISRNGIPDIGFLKLVKDGEDTHKLYLELLAIKPEFRNQGAGTEVVQKLLQDAPPNSNLYVYCTKYARAMQHILKKQKLRRNVRFHAARLEEYQSNFSELH